MHNRKASLASDYGTERLNAAKSEAFAEAQSRYPARVQNYLKKTWE